MKNTINHKLCSIGLMAVLLASSSACTNLLDESFGQVVSENYSPKTEEEVSYLVNAAYIPWRETFLQWNGVVRSQELSADQDVIPARLGIGWVDGYIYKRWHEHTWTTEDDGVLQGWERTYNGINTCNRILSQIEDGEITVDEATREPLIAELKVLRASYYYILVDLYGNVPIVTDFKDSSLPKQSTRKEVFDFIIKEVTENIDLLSETPRGYYYGRFNKWAAHTLLAKMYLNAEVWSGTPQWQKCIDECDVVINFANSSNEYALESNQKNIFVTNNENSKEIIFALPFDEIYVTGWNDFDFHMYTLAPENQDTYQFTERPWGGVCAIPQFIDTFHPNDLRLAQNYIQGQQYTASGEILQRSDGEGPLIYTNSVPSIDASDVDDGYRWGKFEYAQGITNRLSNDWPLFRYADILMMKAEALMRSGQPGAGELVTEVRKRAFEDINDAIVTDQQLEEGSCYDYGRRDENMETHEGGEDIKYGRFLDELGWEFCQEGRRRQDMIRFGVFTTKSWFSHDKSNPNRNLYPIPNKIMLTNSNLTQNPQ
ncbi:MULTISPECIES: RagB/SusD family nutrient uptake outer membrane protein [Bacteroidaceae]|uniref:RagB/SusD family nutrient uptake outer membrane protein n=1 Tax=Phocaeicola intestinalis TaxID=2762212 RepID=A0ABR8YCA1_9BACT|nr:MULTISPECIES: RagB/SusD family nutrient uptake outer membrane protein [Bacteroidaceae]MBD8041849.1 RagB/SusD family nutrient uptake outer membrane protein [Phocaeicola intestinalis]MBM6658679.1 RagB/SusD family nutrient uptake outer membrane protein [Bacteroides gallinaceum]OUO74192.1 RagB/SusD family nutrient uptake outer membrane protein [Bacteroides sp. An269]